MIFYFDILSSFFFSIARNVLNVKAKVSVFFTTLLVDWPHYQYYLTDINLYSCGSKSNWWVSEKRNAVTLGRAGYIDDELILVTPWPYPKSPASPGRANTILAPLATLVCLAGNWLISLISLTPTPCTFPNNVLLRWLPRVNWPCASWVLVWREL